MFTYDMITDCGSREINEDSVRICSQNQKICAAAADGLGGHGFGDEAASFLTSCVMDLFQTNREDGKRFLESCFTEGQRGLRELQEKQKRRGSMLSTLSILMADERRAVWAHVGDTRIYVFEQGRLVQQTKDHSVPQALADAGMIDASQIRHHPDRNRLRRAMGTEWEEPLYTLSEELEVQDGQAFLLCTDGFWEWIEEEEMERTLQQAAAPGAWLASMRELVLQHGAGNDLDNYSAAAIFCDRK